MKVKKAKKYQKIAVLGDAGVGKTSLCTRLTNNCFHSSYELTVGVHIHTYVVTLEEGPHRVLLYDVAGQPRFGDMVDVFVRGSVGILLVYECSSILTFFSLEEVWLPFIRQHLPGVPIVLVASKIDQTDYIEVPDNQAKMFLRAHSNEFNFVGFVKTSAKTGINIEEGVCRLVEACIEQITLQPPEQDILVEREELHQPGTSVGTHVLSNMPSSYNHQSLMDSKLKDDQKP